MERDVVSQSSDDKGGDAHRQRDRRNNSAAPNVKKKVEIDPEELRRQRIEQARATIDDRFSEFDDGYFDGLRTTAREYYEPQFQDQYDAARQSLRFGLARSGNLRSSAGGDALGDLARDRALALTRIEDIGTDTVESRRETLENQRQQLYAQAEAAENPAADASASIARSSYLSKAPTFSAIGDFFTRALNQSSVYQEAENRGNIGYGAINNYFGSGSNASSSVQTKN